MNGKISDGVDEGNTCGRAGYCTFLAIGVKCASMATGQSSEIQADYGNLRKKWDIG